MLFDRFIGYVHSYNASDDATLSPIVSKSSPSSVTQDSTIGQGLSVSAPAGSVTIAGVGLKASGSSPMTPHFWEGVDNTDYVESLAASVTLSFFLLIFRIRIIFLSL